MKQFELFEIHISPVHGQDRSIRIHENLAYKASLLSLIEHIDDDGDWQRCLEILSFWSDDWRPGQQIIRVADVTIGEINIEQLRYWRADETSN